MEEFIILKYLSIKSFDLFKFHIFSPCLLFIDPPPQIIKILLILSFCIFLILNIL